MKYIIYLLLTYCLVGCRNNKERIVEQIKDCKDSTRAIMSSIAKLTVDETLKYEELYWTNGQPDYNKIGNDSLRKLYSDFQAKSEDQKWKLKLKQSYFNNKIDSLELELKKY